MVCGAFLIGPCAGHAGHATGAFESDRWQRFNDATLSALAAEAQRANLDLRMAAERVQQARAGSTAAAASRLAPMVGLTAGTTQVAALPIAVGERLLKVSDVAEVRAALEDPPSFTVRCKAIPCCRLAWR